MTKAPCVLREQGWPKPSPAQAMLLTFSPLGQHCVCQPGAARCRRETLLAGVRMGFLCWKAHLGSVLGLPAVTSLAGAQQVQVSGDRGSCRAWVPECGGRGLGDPAAWNSSMGRPTAGKSPGFSFLLDMKGFKSPSSASYRSALTL